MPHIEIDVDFLTHPKVIRVAPLGQLLFIRSLIYCCQHLTDGILPAAAVPLLGFDLKHDDGEEERNISDELVAQLLKEKLWHARDGGYEINDYLEWQLSRAEVESFIEKKRIAGKKGGQAKQANAKQMLEQNSSTCQEDASALLRSKQGSKTYPDSESESDSDSDKKKKDQEEDEPELVPLPEKHLTVEGAKQLWNAIPGIKPCKELGGALKIKITKLVKEHPASWWLKFFAEIEKSNFLCGRSKPRDDRKPFKADLDWVTGPINLGKILSGKYDDGTRAIIPKAVQVDQEKPGIPPPKEVADRLRRVGIKIPGVTTGEGHA